MSCPVTLREASPEERRALEDLARSRTDEARVVQRARILLGMLRGERPSAVARRLRPLSRRVRELVPCLSGVYKSP